MKYGQLPASLGIHHADVQEMFFYQYLPIKLAGDTTVHNQDRLSVFDEIIGIACCDFVGVFGLNNFVDSYIYITAKHLYQVPNCEFNRPGWHSDGFMTNDINYIWCNSNPTIFNTSDFQLTSNHEKSLVEMEQQAIEDNSLTFREYELLRLNQYAIHKVAPTTMPAMRAFLKISFSNDKYNLIGNSHNYKLNYSWFMKPRQQQRNHPIA